MKEKSPAQPLRDPLPWELQVAWPRVSLGSMTVQAQGENFLPPTLRHHMVLFDADATVSVRNIGRAGWRTLRIGKGDVLAAMAELSPSYFLRAFKASTTMTPVNFTQRRRVLLAQELLRLSKKSLVDIALATGFGSQSRFTTAFRF